MFILFPPFKEIERKKQTVFFLAYQLVSSGRWRESRIVEMVARSEQPAI